jgi:hypothetical protein
MKGRYIMFARLKVSLCFVVCLLLIAGTATAAPFWSMPTGSGHKFYKQDAAGNGWLTTMEAVGKKVVLGGNEYTHIQRTNYYNDGAVEDLYIRPTETGAFMWFGFPAPIFVVGPVGTTWGHPVDMVGRMKYYEITAIEPLTVPYGTFPEAYVVRSFVVPARGSAGPYAYNFYVKNVGMLKETDYWVQTNAHYTMALTGTLYPTHITLPRFTIRKYECGAWSQDNDMGMSIIPGTTLDIMPK